jgi:hypothetical protein
LRVKKPRATKRRRDMKGQAIMYSFSTTTGFRRNEHEVVCVF